MTTEPATLTGVYAALAMLINVVTAILVLGALGVLLIVFCSGD